jgi:hypothetical protein
MTEPEEEPVLDVHPPHEPIHGWRDFLLHLLTITIGLLIALSLEGLVEWQHHRHLVHEAEANLATEIRSNADGLQGVLDDIHKQQDTLTRDVVFLKESLKSPKAPKGSMSVSFRIAGFDDVSWKTAQTTGVFAYMPYSEAKEYSAIYDTQNEVYVIEQQAARDAILAMAPFLNQKDEDPSPTPQEIQSWRHNIETLQAQLLLLDSFVKGLDEEYKKFLAAHPGK